MIKEIELSEAIKVFEEFSRHVEWYMPGPNIVNKFASTEAIELLFGDHLVTRLDVECLTWPMLAVEGGLFSSKTQASKNGWAGPVPYGFGQRKIKSRGKGVWFYNAPPPSPSP